MEVEMAKHRKEEDEEVEVEVVGTAEDEARKQEEEAAQRAKAEKDERRKAIVEEIANSDEGFVTRTESNGQAIDEAMADGLVYNSNVQEGIEVTERYFLTTKGHETRGNT